MSARYKRRGKLLRYTWAGAMTIRCWKCWRVKERPLWRWCNRCDEVMEWWERNKVVITKRIKRGPGIEALRKAVTNHASVRALAKGAR